MTLMAAQDTANKTPISDPYTQDYELMGGI